MRRAILMLLCGALLAGCAEREVEESEALVSVEELPPITEVTLAMYPVGNLGSIVAFSDIVSEFNESQNDIKVTVKYLNYTDGDAVVEDMLDRGERLDMVFESPERLIPNWGKGELLADLSDLWSSKSDGVSKEVMGACKDGSAFYVYPVCMSVHCMAVNRDMLEQVGALQYIDQGKRTWSTDGFLKVVELLQEAGHDSVLVYCASSTGDHGTRALVTNMYGGRYATENHDGYEVSSIENAEALTGLRDTEGVVFSAEDDGATAMAKFCNGEYAMVLCWNASQEVACEKANSLQFDVYPVSFPTVDGGPAKLESSVWGFGVFDTDEEHVDACKEFIKYLTWNDEMYRKVVSLSTYSPVFPATDSSVMPEYDIFTEYVGDYYQVTENWQESRDAWWQMLQRVGDGENIDASIAWFQQEVE